jgi:hypothetical protein
VSPQFSLLLPGHVYFWHFENDCNDQPLLPYTLSHRHSDESSIAAYKNPLPAQYAKHLETLLSVNLMLLPVNSLTVPSS